ncbi:MAG: hypothetical protein AB2777_19045 [Candidatus Thiodiazotropha endolucinida]
MVGAELDNAEALFLMHFVAVRHQKALAGEACIDAEHSRCTGVIEIREIGDATPMVAGYIDHDCMRGVCLNDWKKSSFYTKI